MPRPLSIGDILESLMKPDEFGATKGCGCPRCTAKRMMSDKQPVDGEDTIQPEEGQNPPEVNVQLVSSLMTETDRIDIGHTMDTYPLGIVIKITGNPNGAILTIEEAHLLADSIMVAVDCMEP